MKRTIPLLLSIGLTTFSWFGCEFILAENIDPDHHYAWGENIGWINFKPSQGEGVTVTNTELTGFAWAENLGWINFNPAFGGVLNTYGQLSGYAWGENVGWINFAPASGGVVIDVDTGFFSGFGWGENIGWINFAPTHGGVSTLWRPPEPCNEKIVSNATEYSYSSYEACETLILGPDFTVAGSANLSVSSGLEISFMPGFLIEQGATLNASVCGQSLCEISNSPMPDGCHSCVSAICTADSYCCSGAFDVTCLSEVSSICGLVCE